MAALRHAPLARTIQFRTLTIACSSSSLETTTRVALPPVKNNKQDTPRVLLGMSEMNLQQLALQFNQEKYRGKQLHHLLYKRKIKKIQDFSQVPLAFRNELQEAGWSVGRSPIFKEVTAGDGTVKLLIKLEDNLLVETVGIPVQDDKGSLRLTACVSSQVGCPLRCSFCATGKGGFSRNLKSHEIVEQVLAIEEMFKRRVTNVVFMGMGEPMLNMKQVVEAHRCLNKDIQIGQRMITISTVGVPNTIRKLATHKLQSTLALSLHAPNQQLREKIVPSAKSYPLDAIMNDCKHYFVETGRRVSFEYTLLAGINDTVDNAIELAELLHKWGPGYHVNLIPFNPIEGSEYKRPYRKSVLAFSGRRVLSMLNKRPAVPPPVEEGRAQLWARNVVLNGDNPLDEIPKRANVSSVHRFMLNLIQQNRKGEALHVFTRHLQTVISGIDDFAVALASKASLGHPNIGCQLHGFALVSGFMSYVSVSNSLMNMYCKSRDLRMALYILENSKNPDTVSYNTVLSGFEDNESALVFARGMHSAGIAFDAVTCTSVLAHCADCEEFDFGFQLHCLVSKFGLKAEVFIGNALVTLYSKCGRVMDADKVFCEMPHKDLISWNAILSGYAQEGSYGVEAILGFIEMVRGDMKLDHVSFTSVISACGQEKNLDFGKQVHGLSMKRGYGNHVTICNVLMSLYAKCGIVEDAKMVFQNIVDRNVVSWTTMLSIDEENAVNLFKEMVRDEICPNLVTFVGLIHAIIEHNMVQEGLMVHAFCVKSNFFSEINVTNSFITMYGKFKLVEDFIKVFEELDYREIISWNSLISAYSLNGMFQEALHVFLLASKEITPNPYTFGSVLHAVASSESISLRQGQRCHCYIRKLGLDVDPVVSGALLDMYAKRGSISESQKIFSEMTQKTEVSWTTIISAHSKHGDYEKVMKFFKEMVMEGMKPDSITFLSVLTSCGHNGMVDIGVGIFNSMLDDYSIEPSAEHYSCIVDMLGRAGRLNEAEELLGRIPGGPGISVLQSLLGACRIHGNVEMAVRVSDALIAMEPNDSGSYVLMSNLFAEKGKWENVAKLRRMMRDRKVTKEVGFSWADVGDSLHLHGFSSGDKTHPLSKEIYVMAELLGSEMKRRRAIIGDM